MGYICCRARVSIVKRLSDAASESNFIVDGGEYTCKASNNGGFLYVSAAARVSIIDTVVSNNIATRRGGAVSGFRVGGGRTCRAFQSITFIAACVICGELVATLRQRFAPQTIPKHYLRSAYMFDVPYSVRERAKHIYSIISCRGARALR